MSCCLPSEAPKFIVIVKDGKYKNQRAVIQTQNPRKKIFRLRLLDVEKPFLDRFYFTKSGQVTATSAKFKIIFLPPERFLQTSQKTFPLINQGWDQDTSSLFTKFKNQKQVIQHAIKTNQLNISNATRKNYKPLYLKKIKEIKKKTKHRLF